MDALVWVSVVLVLTACRQNKGGNTDFDISRISSLSEAEKRVYEQTERITDGKQATSAAKMSAANRTFISRDSTFSVSYPAGWRAVEIGENGTIFAPLVMAEGYQWSILAYDKQKNPLEKLVATMGDGLGAARQEEREILTINGMEALKVKITSREDKEWHYTAVYVNAGNIVYQMANPTVPDRKFEDFYRSFKILKQ